MREAAMSSFRDTMKRAMERLAEAGWDWTRIFSFAIFDDQKMQKTECMPTEVLPSPMFFLRPLAKCAWAHV